MTGAKQGGLKVKRLNKKKPGADIYGNMLLGAGVCYVPLASAFCWNLRSAGDVFGDLGTGAKDLPG